MTGNTLDASAVIVNYRTMEFTCEAAASVLMETGVREVVIVDNASHDGSADFLKRELADPRVQVVSSPQNVGFGRGVNLGVHYCTAPLLLVLNSDAKLVAGSLVSLARTLVASESVAVVAPAVYTAETGDLQRVAYGVFPTVRSIIRRTNLNPPDTLFPDWVSGVAMLMRRSDFQSIGGFDPDFQMYLEDVDLCRRFRQAGKEIRRDVTAAVIHAGAKSWSSSSSAFQEAQKSRVLYFRKAGFGLPSRVVVRAIRLGHLIRPHRPRAAHHWRI